MTKKTSPLQPLRDGPPREKREHPGEPPRTTNPHPRAAALRSAQRTPVASALQR